MVSMPSKMDEEQEKSAGSCGDDSKSKDGDRTSVAWFTEMSIFFPAMVLAGISDVEVLASAPGSSVARPGEVCFESEKALALTSSDRLRSSGAEISIAILPYRALSAKVMAC